MGLAMVPAGWTRPSANPAAERGHGGTAGPRPAAGEQPAWPGHRGAASPCKKGDPTRPAAWGTRDTSVRITASSSRVVRRATTTHDRGMMPVRLTGVVRLAYEGAT